MRRCRAQRCRCHAHGRRGHAQTSRCAPETNRCAPETNRCALEMSPCAPGSAPRAGQVGQRAPIWSAELDDRTVMSSVWALDSEQASRAPGQENRQDAGSARSDRLDHHALPGLVLVRYQSTGRAGDRAAARRPGAPCSLRSSWAAVRTGRGEGSAPGRASARRSPRRSPARARCTSTAASRTAVATASTFSPGSFRTLASPASWRFIPPHRAPPGRPRARQVARPRLERERLLTGRSAGLRRSTAARCPR